MKIVAIVVEASMADDPKKRKQDARRISLLQRWERRYWTRKLGVTLERLKFAVAAVGHSAQAVRAFMARDKWARTKE